MRKIKGAAALLLLITLTAACSDKAPAPEPPSETVSATVTEPPAETDFDLLELAENTRTSVLLEKYGSFTVKTVMDYGEKTEIESSFGSSGDGYTYINKTSDSVEYYDGNNDYLLEESPDGESYLGSALLSLPGAEPTMELENFIFKYSEDDGLSVTGYTQEKDGSYTVNAYETFSESYDDAEGEEVNISYKFEYVIKATEDREVSEINCICTDVNTGETNHTLNIKAEYGTKMPEPPEYMNETFEITVIVISGENEVTSVFEVPEAFQPRFAEPADGSYTFYYDRAGTSIIEDTMMIDYPCMIYAIKNE